MKDVITLAVVTTTMVIGAFIGVSLLAALVWACVDLWRVML